MAAVVFPLWAPCGGTFCSLRASILGFPVKLTEKIKLKEAASVFEADRGRQEHTQSAEDGAPTRPGLDAGAGVTFPRVPSTCEASGALGFLFSGAGASPEEAGRPGT